MFFPQDSGVMATDTTSVTNQMFDGLTPGREYTINVKSLFNSGSNMNNIDKNTLVQRTCK